MSSAVSVLVRIGAERLVQLVGDRGRQLSDGRIAIDMREFGQALPRLDLGYLPAMASHAAVR